MITFKEVDKSVAVPNVEGLASLLVSRHRRQIKPQMIGKWNRRKFQYLSHRGKREFVRRWQRGEIQRKQFITIFGSPDRKANG